MTDRAAGYPRRDGHRAAPRTPGTSPPASGGLRRPARRRRRPGRGSVKTVSNVVNGYVHVSPGTRAKVEAASWSSTTGPTWRRGSLRRGRSGILALAVPELERPVLRRARPARRRASAAGAAGRCSSTRPTASPTVSCWPWTASATQLIDGLIFSPLAAGLASWPPAGTPRRWCCSASGSYDGPADHVLIDNVAAARTVVDHLIDLGRRRVAAIGAQRTGRPGRARLRLARVPRRTG